MSTFRPLTALALLAALFFTACAPLFDAINEALPALDATISADQASQNAQDAEPTQDSAETEAQASETPATPDHTAQPSPKTTKTPKASRTPTPKAAEASPTALESQPMGDFDYFVLALSWAPDFCANNDDPQECAIGKRLGFVLHGLWPQYASGYPSNCTDETLPASVKAQFPNLYPNDKLYSHEWEKHGTCSGLTPSGYLALTKQIRDSVIIPTEFKRPAEPFRITTAALKDAFLQANPGYSANSLAPSCSGSGRFLTELLVCFAKDGSPQACGSDVLKNSSKSCAQKDYLVRNTR